MKDTTTKLKKLNQKMVDVSRKGDATRVLEAEKRQLERELQIQKKMAAQQRKELFTRGESVRNETQQWKLVAGEMVDLLSTVRYEGNFDKESLEKELQKIMGTLNDQNELIENLKKDISKHEKSQKNLEKDKTRMYDEKLLAEDQLEKKQTELRQCKQHLRKVLAEKKDNIPISEAVTADLTEETEETKPIVGPSEDFASTDILQAQVRDARKKAQKLEKENKELQRKLESLDGAEKPFKSTDPPSQVENIKTKSSAEECPNCSSYRAQLSSQLGEIKKNEQEIAHTEEELNKLRLQLRASKKKDNTNSAKSDNTTSAKSASTPARAHAEMWSKKTPATKAVGPTQTSSEDYTESGEEIEEDQTGSDGKKKRKAVRSIKKSSIGKKEEHLLRDDGEGDESIEEEEDKVDKLRKAADSRDKKERQGGKSKGVNSLVGECREEKAPYVTVREANVVTLANKGTQTSQCDRKLYEGISQQQSVSRPPPPQDEADRLCDEISRFVEYGYDLAQQDAKTTRTLPEKHLGEKDIEMLESTDAENIPIDKAKALRAFASTEQGIPSRVGNKRRQQQEQQQQQQRSSLQLKRGGTISRASKHQISEDEITGKETEIISAEVDSTHPEVVYSEKTVPRVEEHDSVTGERDTAITKEEDTIDRKEPGIPDLRFNTFFSNQQAPEEPGHTFEKSQLSTLNNFVHSLQPHSHVPSAEGSESLLREDQAKGQPTVMAQHAIDTLQRATKVVSDEPQYRKRRLTVDHTKRKGEVPLVGRQVLLRLEEAKKTREGEAAINPEESSFFTPIISQVSSCQTSGRMPLSTVQVSQGGGMMIIGATPNKPIPSTGFQTKMKTRGKVKVWSKRDSLPKHKAVTDKVFHVDARIVDLTNTFDNMEEPQRQRKQSRGIPQTLPQEFPFLTHSVALPSLANDFPQSTRSVAQPPLPQAIQRQGAVGQSSKVDVTGESAKNEEQNESTKLPVMNNSNWQRRQFKARFPSQTLRKSSTKQETKLPLLNISHFLNVGQ